MDVESAQNQIEKLQAQLHRWNFTAYKDGPNTEEELTEVETQVGHRLPEDFRWFCATYGDGYTRRHQLSIELEDDSSVEFDRLGNAHNIKFGNQTYLPPNFPSGLVPCATTIMGDVFFLRLDPEHGGSVWYWGYYEGKDKTDGLSKAADSFTDLLASSQHIIAHTDRLTLRVVERDDTAALFEILGSPTTMELMPRGLLEDEAAALSWIEERRSLQQEFGYSQWSVVLRSTGRVIGSCGFRRSDTGGPFELGYVIGHDYWGHGYATEAATAAIDHVFTWHVAPGSVATVFATIRPNNDPSIAVARRLGMRQVEPTADEHGELLKFELDNQ